MVKHGAGPAVVSRPDIGAVEVPAITVSGVTDTTGAGDAFAAGLLLALAAGADPVAAVQRGHEVAAEQVRVASAPNR